MSPAGRRCLGAAAVAACFAFMAAVFFALLSLWGLLAAPFARLRSSSFVIVCALALSSVATVMAYRAIYRAIRPRRGATRSPRL